MNNLSTVPGLTVEKLIILVCSYFDHVQLSYGLLLAGFGGKVKVGNSWGSSSLDGAELSRSPQCTRVHPGPHPTRKERPANRPASINKFPYKEKTKKNIGYYLSKLVSHLQPQSIQNIKPDLPLSDGLFDWDGST